MKKVYFLVLLLLYSGVTFSVSESEFSILKPHTAESFNVSQIQTKNQGSCSYVVIISTSCSSTKYTRDQISIAFGDAYGNQVYAPRLDDPASGTFERCSSDTFQINGPCAYQICYVYLYRSGVDGWKPESVRINGYNGKPVTFYYDTFIPRDTWFGFDLCNDASSSYHVSTRKWLISMVLGFVLSFWL